MEYEVRCRIAPTKIDWQHREPPGMAMLRTEQVGIQPQKDSLLSAIFAAASTKTGAENNHE